MFLLKKSRISIKIAALIGLVEVVAMSLFFLIINQNLSKILEHKAMSDMNVIIRDRAQLVETYISGCCNFVDGYARNPVVRNFIQNKDKASAVQQLHELTKAYATSHNYIEGLYIADWDTYVYEHTNKDSMNKTFREKDKAKELEDSIKNEDKAFCTGIVLAPVTKKMVIPVYAPVYDEKGQAVCFAGAAFYTTGLEEILSSITVDDIEYSVLNANNGQYIFSSDRSLVGKNCEDKFLLRAIKLFQNQIKTKIFNYKSDKSVASCFYMEERNWIFVIEDSNENVFGIINSVRKIILAICIMITILMLVTCALSVEYQMKPIRKINTQIENLKVKDFSHSDLLNKYLLRKDEFGVISNAVKELQARLENQNQLFSEVLEAQTVGTLVTDSADNNIILVNNMALKLWGINQALKTTLRMEDIKDRFDEAETEKIANIRQLAKMSKEEVVYETYAIHEDGQKVHLLSHAKSVNLSNGENVIIFSFIDISAQKKLEENLLILSETDSLTTICNRRSGEYKIKKAMSEGKRGLFCTLDANKFKFINDNFGHSAGDKVLVEIAKCMKQSFRTTDILIRFGGDEFAIFAPDIEKEEIANTVLERFMNNITKISIPELQNHKVSVSLGAIIIDSNETFEQIYKKADSLMYECKKEGGNVFKFY